MRAVITAIIAICILLSEEAYSWSSTILAAGNGRTSRCRWRSGAGAGNRILVDLSTNSIGGVGGVVVLQGQNSDVDANANTNADDANADADDDADNNDIELEKPYQAQYGVSYIGGDPCGSKYNDDPFDVQVTKPGMPDDMKARIQALAEKKKKEQLEKE